MALPTLQGALKDGFGEAVMACDMPKPCRFLSLDWCQKRFLWTHKEVDLPPHPVVGLVLQVGDAEKFLQALGFKGLHPFLFFVVVVVVVCQSQQTESMFHKRRAGRR